MLALRPYQEAAVAGAYAELRNGARRVVLVMATGTGKTVVASRIALDAASRGRRILWLANRRELVTQGATHLRAAGLTVGVEMGRSTVHTPHRFQAIVASVDSLRGARLDRLPPDTFGLIVVDEAHHAVAETWRAVVERFPDALAIGLTATPERHDGVSLNELFDAQGFRYPIQTAIQDRMLVPVRMARPTIEGVDLSQERVGKRSGDYSDEAIARQLAREGPMHQAARVLADVAGQRSGLLFCATVNHAERQAAVLARYVGVGNVEVVHGGTKNRDAIVDAFKRGEIQFLSSCGVFLEGFDAPRAAIAGMLRPTRSVGLKMQMLGRVTRLLGRTLDESIEAGKPDCVAVDFAGLGDENLATVVDAIAGGRVHAGVRRRAEALAADGKEVTAALEEAQSTYCADLTATVRYELSYVDPFAALGIRPVEAEPWAPRMTERQRDALARFGLLQSDVDLSRRQAGALLDEAINRARAGLATVRQVRALLKRGVAADRWTREAASAVLDALADVRWDASAPTVGRLVNEIEGAGGRLVGAGGAA